MAAKRDSILSELYNSVFNYDLREEFTSNVASLNARDGVTLRGFNEGELSLDYELDRSHMVDANKFYDGNHVFKLFAEFSDLTPSEIRAAMINDIESSTDYYDDVCKIPLFMQRTDLKNWIHIMKLDGVRADEIALFALAIISQ